MPSPNGSTPEYMHVAGRNCPECDAPLDRIPRRLVDRVTSLFGRTQRYRCRGFSCRWEGNLRDSRTPATARNPAG